MMGSWNGVGLYLLLPRRENRRMFWSGTNRLFGSSTSLRWLSVGGDEEAGLHANNLVRVVAQAFTFERRYWYKSGPLAGAGVSDGQEEVAGMSIVLIAQLRSLELLLSRFRAPPVLLHCFSSTCAAELRLRYRTHFQSLSFTVNPCLMSTLA
jgi:hypothetical protein